MVTNQRRRDDHFGLWDQDYWSGLYVRQLASINIKTRKIDNKQDKTCLLKYIFFRQPEARVLETKKGLCVNTIHTLLKVGTWKGNPPTQVKLRWMNRSSRQLVCEQREKLCSYHDKIITQQKEPFTTSCSLRRQTSSKRVQTAHASTPTSTRNHIHCILCNIRFSSSMRYYI